MRVRACLLEPFACLLVGAALSACTEPGDVSGWQGSVDLPGDSPPVKAADGSCLYPAGPYGVDQGQILPPTLSWQGLRPGQSELTTITAADLFDCDGGRGIHAVLLVTSQHGCAPCTQESSSLEARMHAWAPLGVTTAVLLLDDPYEGPPTEAGALGWKRDFSLERVGVYLDPAFSLVPTDVVYTPMQTVIDPRSMTVVARTEGLIDTFPTLEALAAHNGASL